MLVGLNSMQELHDYIQEFVKKYDKVEKKILKFNKEIPTWQS